MSHPKVFNVNSCALCSLRPINKSGLALALSLFPVLLAGFFLLSCAAVAPPSGGPIDKTPPSLISVDPPSGTTGISENFVVTLTFSERIDESASLKGVRIAPPLETPVKVSAKKDRIRVIFPEEISANQTYLVTATREIVDEHGNRLDRTHQLAFSSGSRISGGRIDGMVYDRKGASSIVYLYRVDGIELDSLFTGEPDYYTETDDSGRYSFSYLEAGDYQVVAFQGGAPPTPISPSRMPHGIHWNAPISVAGDDTVKNVNMKLFREVPPLRVVSAEMESSHRGVVRFTNPVHLSAQENLVIEFVDPDNGRPIRPGVLFQYRDGDREIRLHTEDLEVREDYTLTVSGIQDSAGQILSEFRRTLVIPDMDTLRPVLISPEAEKKVWVNPGNTPLDIQFNGVVHVENQEEAVSLRDTSHAPLRTRIRWENPTRIEVIPERGWQPEGEYELELLGSQILSPQGTGMTDSTIRLEIRVNPEPGYGGLYGTVVGKFVENSLVVAESPEKPSISYSGHVNFEGDFAFKKLPALYWILKAYQDRDGNGRYSFGRAIPFRPSEPFLIFPDTIEVRANWDREGIILEYPEDES